MSTTATTATWPVPQKTTHRVLLACWMAILAERYDVGVLGAAGILRLMFPNALVVNYVYAAVAAGAVALVPRVSGGARRTGTAPDVTQGGERLG